MHLSDLDIEETGSGQKSDRIWGELRYMYSWLLFVGMKCLKVGLPGTKAKTKAKDYF